MMKNHKENSRCTLNQDPNLLYFNILWQTNLNNHNRLIKAQQCKAKIHNNNNQ